MRTIVLSVQFLARSFKLNLFSGEHGETVKGPPRFSRYAIVPDPEVKLHSLLLLASDIY